jgi:hypothetical protein
MLTLIYVRPIDLVAPLNTMAVFYNTPIIKQNNMAYQHKISIRNQKLFPSGIKLEFSQTIHTLVELVNHLSTIVIIYKYYLLRHKLVIRN